MSGALTLKSVGRSAWKGVKAVARALGLTLMVIFGLLEALGVGMGRFLAGLVMIALAVWLIVWIGGWWLDIAREDGIKAAWIAAAVIATIAWMAKSSRVQALEAAMMKAKAAAQDATTGTKQSVTKESVTKEPAMKESVTETQSPGQASSSTQSNPVMQSTASTTLPALEPAEPVIHLDHARCAEFVSRMEAFVPWLRAAPLGRHADRDMNPALFMSLIEEAEALRDLAVQAGIDRLPEFGSGEFKRCVWRHMTYASQLLAPRRDWMRSIEGPFGDLSWLSTSDYFPRLAQAVGRRIGRQTELQCWHDAGAMEALASSPVFQALLEQVEGGDRSPDTDALLLALLGDGARYAPGYPLHLRTLGAVGVVQSAAYVAVRRAKDDSALQGVGYLYLPGALARVWDANESTLAVSAPAT